MLEIPSLRPESRYGMPNADQYIFNRAYIVGYSYLFRQPSWTLELIDPKSSVINTGRSDNFRPDHRVPEIFRADLDDFSGTGFDRGHMVSSAEKRSEEILNSETFLLSNMSPQAPDLNRRIWRDLEAEVRVLAARPTVLEVYVVSGIMFDITRPFKLIGQGPSKVIVPHWYFKSILAEDNRGKLKMWTFAIPNEKCTKPLTDYLVTTRHVEIWTGLHLWERLVGTDIEKQKAKVIKWT